MHSKHGLNIYKEVVTLATLITVKQAAEQMQVSTKTIFRRIEDGSIKAIRLGNKIVRIEQAELDRYISEHEHRKG